MPNAGPSGFEAAATGITSPRAEFCVVLHDVAPPFAIQVEKVVAALAPLVGSRMVAAVVPAWHGRTITAADGGFVRFVQDTFDEILLHGCEHRRTRGAGPVSVLTGRSDEFNGLSAEETAARLRRGQDILRDSFGRSGEGFIAPAYQRGMLDSSLLAAADLRFRVGFHRIVFDDGRRRGLATWCWDMGTLRPLGYAGHALGHAMRRLRPAAVPCLALHPLDVDRRFLKRAVRLVERLMAKGGRPVLAGEL